MIRAWLAEHTIKGVVSWQNSDIHLCIYGPA